MKRLHEVQCILETPKIQLKRPQHIKGWIQLRHCVNLYLQSLCRDSDASGLYCGLISHHKVYLTDQPSYSFNDIHLSHTIIALPTHVPHSLLEQKSQPEGSDRLSVGLGTKLAGSKV